MFKSENLKQGSGWIIALLGISCYVVGYWTKTISIYGNALWPDILIKIADVLIIGVVVGYLTGIAQWAGIFKKEIQDIIYGKDFLKKRNDIEDIWYNVTKQMFKFKFSEIHENMLSALKNVLPSEDDISYYEDFDADSKIEWVDKDKGIINCYDNFSMDIVTETDKPFDYTIKSWVAENPQHPDGKVTETLEVFVDSKKRTDLNTNSIQDGGDKRTETKVTLSGKKRYSLQYSRKQTYNIFDDYYIGYRARFITHNMNVSLELPSDIEAIFIERGTVNSFRNVKTDKSHIKKRYKGVIFPKQGYIFALRVK